MTPAAWPALSAEIARCRQCADRLPLGPRPIFAGSATARLRLISQAPGRKAHLAGVPFADASGDRLRDWLGITPEVFYDERQVAILPMGFCYPGTGASGDLPPRPECAPAWRRELLGHLTQVRLTLVIGQYAQHYYLRDEGKDSLTETVLNWADYGPAWLPLPHPSPRNTFWLKKNPWFEQEVIPHLQQRVAPLLL